uniref:Titin n=1 Tax=Cyclopterus lumpus TaxID=8103 RepID=A0A8C2ZQB4_CYCLU
MEKPDGVSVVRVGDRKLFECKVAGSPEITVHWFRDGAELQQSVKHVMLFMNSVASLEICEVSENDSGKYFCEVCNEAGTESCTVDEHVILKIQKCDVEDVGAYQCVVANEVGTFVKKIESVSSILGAVAVFRCSVEGSPPLSVQWQKDENWIPEDPTVERTFENKEATLRIPSCEATHGGKYTCQVVNEAGQDKCTVALTAMTVQVTRGNPVSLECRLTGTPQIRVRWTKDGKELQSSRKHHLSYKNNLSSLNMKSTQMEDGGEYLFEATNSVGTCSCKMEPVEVSVGDAVTLKCRILGTPDISVAWFKSDGKLRKSNTCSSDFSNGVATLKLTKTTTFDQAEYICKAENRVGSASASCQVAPKFDIPLEPVTTSEGEKLSLKCLVSGSPPLTVQWMKDRRELKSSGKIRITLVGGAPCLEVSPVSKSDGGDYLCKASNAAGSNFCKSRVTVKGDAHLLASTVVQFLFSASDGGSPIIGYYVEKMRSDGTEFEVANRKLLTECCLKDPFGLPGPPRNPKIIAATATSMTVTWDPPLDNGGSTIQGYWLEKRERGAVYWGRVNRASLTKPSVKGLEYTVLKLIEGSEYQFRIAACNAAGVGPPCESSECRLAADPCSNITLTWSPPERDGGSPIKGYIIEVHEEGSPDWRRVNPADKLHPSTEITVPELKEGKKCKFRIYAVNAAGNSEPAKTGDILVQDILSKRPAHSNIIIIYYGPLFLTDSKETQLLRHLVKRLKVKL